MHRGAPGEGAQQTAGGFSAWLYKQLASHTLTPGAELPAASRMPANADGAAVGRRAKPIGLGARRKRAAGDYAPGFGWQSLALSAIVIAVAFSVLVPSDVLERIVHGPTPVAVLRPDVLVVGGSPSEQAAVIQTMRPRGYTVRVAANPEAGLENLRREPGRIGFVIIDNNLAGAKRMAGAAKSACPYARVVLLDDDRGAGRISQLLVDAGMD